MWHYWRWYFSIHFLLLAEQDIELSDSPPAPWLPVYLSVSHLAYNRLYFWKCKPATSKCFFFIRISIVIVYLLSNKTTTKKCIYPVFLANVCWRGCHLWSILTSFFFFFNSEFTDVDMWVHFQVFCSFSLFYLPLSTCVCYSTPTTCLKILKFIDLGFHGSTQGE